MFQIEFSIDNKKAADEIIQNFNLSTDVILNRYLHVELVDFHIIMVRKYLLEKLKSEIERFNLEFKDQFHKKGPFSRLSANDPTLLSIIKKQCPEILLPRDEDLAKKKESDTVMLRICLKENHRLNASFISQISKYLTGEDIIVPDKCSREMFGEEGKSLQTILYSEHGAEKIFIEPIPFKNIWRVHALPVVFAEIKRSIEDRMLELESEIVLNFRYSLTGLETTVLLSNQRTPLANKSPPKTRQKDQQNYSNFELLKQAVAKEQDIG